MAAVHAKILFYSLKGKRKTKTSHYPLIHSVTCFLCSLESSNCARYQEELCGRTSSRLRVVWVKPTISAVPSSLSIALFTWAKAMWTERKTKLTKEQNILKQFVSLFALTNFHIGDTQGGLSRFFQRLYNICLSIFCSTVLHLPYLQGTCTKSFKTHRPELKRNMKEGSKFTVFCSQQKRKKSRQSR